MSDTWGQDHWDNIDGDTRHMDPDFEGELQDGKWIRRCPHCNKRNLSESREEAFHANSKCGNCKRLINTGDEK